MTGSLRVVCPPAKLPLLKAPHIADRPIEAFLPPRTQVRADPRRECRIITQKVVMARAMGTLMVSDRTVKLEPHGGTRLEAVVTT